MLAASELDRLLVDRHEFFDPSLEISVSDEFRISGLRVVYGRPPETVCYGEPLQLPWRNTPAHVRVPWLLLGGRGLLQRSSFFV